MNLREESIIPFIEWLANGARGVSSNTIASILSGVDCMQGHSYSHPYDSSDYERCDGLLNRVPEFKDRLQEMANISTYWRELVKDWKYSGENINEVIKRGNICNSCGKEFNAYSGFLKNGRGYCSISCRSNENN